jgi:hypothetical protein
VDYPASSPEVVGVGGTSLSPVGTTSSPNDGSDWSETAWSCTDQTSCSDPTQEGSGGGISGVFSKPTYQNAITNSPFSSATQRLVPDISAEANPMPVQGAVFGFPFYTSDPTDGPGDFVAGGTSLAAPVSASLFTDALAAHSATHGVGDIHPALYGSSAMSSGAFRDITSGSNGAPGDAGSDPSVNAGPGYDTVTGLGAPLWPAIVQRLFSPAAAPTTTATLALVNPHSSTAPRAVTAHWSAAAANGGLPLAGSNVTITAEGRLHPIYSNTSAPPTGSTTLPSSAVTPGATYVISVTASDTVGTTSKPATATVQVPIDDKQFSFLAAWHRVNDAADIGGSMAETSTRNASATAAGVGQSYSLVVRTGPSFGKLRVSAGSTTLKTVDLYSTEPGSKTITIYSSNAAPKARTFRFTCLDQKSRASHGVAIDLDALYVRY